MCTVEAPIHNNIKEEIVRAQETDTALVLRRWKNTTRLYRNKVTDQALKVERESTSGEFAEIAPFVSGARGRQVFVNGDPEYGVSGLLFIPSLMWIFELRSMLIWNGTQVWTAGQVIGLIHDIPTCAVLVDRISTEAENALKEKLTLVSPTQSRL